METKELKIQVPEGYEIDKEKSTFEKIVFKKKDNKPRSWEEYCKKSKGKSLYYINENGIEAEIGIDYAFRELDPSVKNTIPSKELAEAFLAMMQLMSLRQAWIGDWEPDWDNRDITKYCIDICNENFAVYSFGNYRRPLSFPTYEMAIDFMNCFEDLLEIAKPLI
jgi:hypothetical protein